MENSSQSHQNSTRLQSPIKKKIKSKETKTSAFSLHWKTLKNNDSFCSVVMHLVLIAEWTKFLRLQSHRSPVTG